MIARRRLAVGSLCWTVARMGWTRTLAPALLATRATIVRTMLTNALVDHAATVDHVPIDLEPTSITAFALLGSRVILVSTI